MANEIKVKMMRELTSRQSELDIAIESNNAAIDWYKQKLIDTLTKYADMGVINDVLLHGIDKKYNLRTFC